ncbi:MAG: alpha/beta fold hydrolase [Pseudomonadota bacterium]|nr:alpha/beta fold hydrolase [Pseudomonadota bacterium]
MRFFLLSVALLPACTHLKPELVDIDGRAVEIVTAGEGANTVLFESGLGADWSPWDKVAYDILRDARVFAYSRPGYGRSDDATTARDPAQIVEELRGLLASQDLAPPYVLAGHSFGGTYMELFAKAYPEEVSALVMVDPRPKDFLEECESQGLDSCGIPDDALATQPETDQAEYTAFAQAAEQITGEFGSYPVQVLTGTEYPGTSDAQIALWQSMQGDIADEAVDGEQLVIEGPHNLQFFRWEDVSEAIRSVLP